MPALINLMPMQVKRLQRYLLDWASAMLPAMWKPGSLPEDEQVIGRGDLLSHRKPTKGPSKHDHRLRCVIEVNLVLCGLSYCILPSFHSQEVVLTFNRCSLGSRACLIKSGVI